MRSGRHTGLPDMSLRMLEIFATMIRCETTVETADVLRISQPAVSAALRQLEGQLGLRLFERSGRRLIPTAEARELYQEIRPIFGLMRGISARAHDMKMGLAGRLRIVSTPPLGHSVAPDALERLVREGPQISVAFDVRRLEEVVDAVQTGTADIGLALTQGRFDTVNLDVLHRAHMVALVAKDDPLAQHPHVTPADIADRPMIGLDAESQLGQLVRGAFAQTGTPYTPRVEVRYCETATVLAAKRMGVTVVDPYSAHIRDGGLIERPFLPSCEVRAVLLTRRGVPHTGLMHRFIALLRTCLSELALTSAPASRP
ncbi:LysR family transcriptional regulator [Falsirhodobacter halotolerans]|uniref:LysR family transcriptional regulator n=1 Tax=Falsirhodobacter halotolerans TaxID=1146892 RepID=UPI001FD272FE|nr:LysR family transcriptional regulator [Falsirhodobacter halotolerans]MCJ8141225.1 LysR family transcriptional regulator [Falsirhodobacter halotolerans]